METEPKSEGTPLPLPYGNSITNVLTLPEQGGGGHPNTLPILFMIL